jgi:hypothetical protein
MFWLNNNLSPNLTRNSVASSVKISRAWFVTRETSYSEGTNAWSSFSWRMGEIDASESRGALHEPSSAVIMLFPSSCSSFPLSKLCCACASADDEGNCATVSCKCCWHTASVFARTQGRKDEFSWLVRKADARTHPTSDGVQHRATLSWSLLPP